MPKFVFNKSLFLKMATCGLIFSFLFGCTTTTSKPVFTEAANFNILDFGRYKVSIDKRFVPVGDIEHKLHVDNIDDPKGSNFKYRIYTLADVSEGKDNIKRVIFISDGQLTDPHHNIFREASFDNFKERHIEKGMTELHNIRVAYLIRAVYGIAPEVLKLCESQGYRMSIGMKHNVEVQFAKVIGRSRIIHITYFESGKVNYENNNDEVKRAVARAESCIRLEK